MTSRRSAALVGCLLAAALLPTQAASADDRPFLRAPASQGSLPVKLAVAFELRFHLAAGGDLEAMLVQADVDADDAAAAARLAAGTASDTASGCYVKIAITKSLNGNGFRIERLTLLTEASQTVMERRGGELTVSASGARVTRLRSLV